MPTPALVGSPPPARSEVAIDAARPADEAAFHALIVSTTPGVPVPLAVASVVHLQPGPPFTHGTTLALVARTPDSPQPAGALLAGIPKWVYEHEMCAGTLLPTVLSRLVFTIHGVAVAPHARGRGIARKLIRAAERRAREADFTLATLEHQPNLTGFYTRLGYHTGDRQLIIALTRNHFLGQVFGGMHTASKPLAPHVRVMDVPGAPARIVTGMLPDTTLPVTARMERGQLLT
ncbi:GNAT family N-acetyltransferase [Streptomyces sp. NPDC047082]|uniref:GNAT family N-acetyltransferase n=1 Tax=Streptomyces sp. NPDC047082 TaxID=3155259 RepID=UPI0033C9B6CF